MTLLSLSFSSVCQFECHCIEAFEIGTRLYFHSRILDYIADVWARFTNHRLQTSFYFSLTDLTAALCKTFYFKVAILENLFLGVMSAETVHRGGENHCDQYPPAI